MNQAENEKMTELTYNGSALQKLRALRSQKILDKYGVPSGVEIYIQDESTATLRSPIEVARRAVCLYGSILRAEGVSTDDVKQILRAQQLDASLTKRERVLLDTVDVSKEDKWYYGWSNERLHVLLWSLGKLPALGWPNKLCEVPELVRLMESFCYEKSFYVDAALLPQSTILDELDLTLRINWALRDARFHAKPVPANLNWKEPSALVDLSKQSPESEMAIQNAGVVEERHMALLWLICSQGGAGWDEVKAHT